MLSMFQPLVEISGYDHLAAELKTADLPADIKTEQTSRFSQLRHNNSDLILVGSSRFILKFRCGDEQFLAFSVEDLSNDEKTNIIDFMISEGLSLHRVEECFFIYMRHTLGRHYRLKREHRNATSAVNIIDVIDDSYAGHLIEDLLEYFEDIMIYRLPKQSIYIDRSAWYAVARLASGTSHYRSPILSNELAYKIGSLVEIDIIPDDNIYVALTGIHWKYVFFELYKCLEKVFYLPWHYSLKQELAYELSAASLAKLCRAKLDWRVTETKSIQNLFELLEMAVFGNDLRESITFRDLNVEPLSKQAFGRRVYKVRNILVHQQDYEDETPIHMNDESWIALCNFMCDVLQHIYTTYRPDILD